MPDLLKRTDCLMGVFDDDDVFVNAVKDIREQNLEIKDAFTPFPIHGLPKAMGLHESRLGYVAFIGGIIGGGGIFTIMTLMMYVNWPMNFGGKPTWPVPNFIPITFELTVLLSAISIATAYFLRNTMLPGFEPKIYHPRSTSDRFVVLVAKDNNEDTIKDVMRKHGAEEIKDEEYLEQKAPLPLPIKMK